jgi:hypothetical protein
MLYKTSLYPISNKPLLNPLSSPVNHHLHGDVFYVGYVDNLYYYLLLHLIKELSLHIFFFYFQNQKINTEPVSSISTLSSSYFSFFSSLSAQNQSLISIFLLPFCLLHCRGMPFVLEFVEWLSSIMLL